MINNKHMNTISRMWIKTASGLIAPACAAIIENIIFHPLDTIVKRLEADTTHTRDPQHLSRIIFHDAHDKSLLAKYKSLLPGFNFAIEYKIFQRMYKFGGQPLIRSAVTKRLMTHPYVIRKFGESGARILCEAVSGSLVGAGEVVLLPLDALKIKMQAQLPMDSPKVSVRELIAMCGGVRQLYNGAGWTILRNVPGSFALFGTSALVREKVFGLKGGGRKNNATLFQHFVSSFAGSVASILVASPMDVLKMRAQVGKKISLVEIVRNEGVMSLWKGTSMKLVSAGPRLIFAYTLSQWLINKVEYELVKDFKCRDV